MCCMGKCEDCSEVHTRVLQKDEMCRQRHQIHASEFACSCMLHKGQQNTNAACLDLTHLNISGTYIDQTIRSTWKCIPLLHDIYV